MTSPPWMPLYVGDYLADTGELTTLEHGAYFLLIMNYWQKGGLPTEDEKLASITRLSLKRWLKIKPTLGKLFSSNWEHKRVDKELARAAAISLKRQRAGRANAGAFAKQMREHLLPPSQRKKAY
jgi:uncharacterized protein YdaU (DUF1376 family)